MIPAIADTRKNVWEVGDIAGNYLRDGEIIRNK